MKSRLAFWVCGGVLAIAFAALGQPSAYRPIGDPALVTDLPASRDYIPPQGIIFKTTNFVSENVRLTAQWFYATPNEGKKLPTVIMAHGWGATAANFRQDAVDLARAGYLVMLFDYRGWGESDGRVMLTGGRPPAGKAAMAQVRELRGYFDPWEQNEDWFNAINYVVTNPMADEGRIGIRGSSESGGHVIYVAAHEPRVKALVSQVSRLDFRPSRAAAEVIAAANATASRIAAGQEQYPEDRSRAIGSQVGSPVGNKVVRWAPLEQAGRVTAPALFFLAQNEDQFPNKDNGQAACDRVKGPRKMLIAPNTNHNDVYGLQREAAITVAIDWFDKYLKPAGAPTRIPVNTTEPARGDCDPPAKLEIEGIGAGSGQQQDDKDAQGKVGTAGAPPPQDASGRWN
jgi:dienelactone hydrolase